MLSIANTSFAGIDFETAGTAPGQTDFPVQIGLVLWSVEQGFEFFFDSYIAPQGKVTWKAQKVHGISDKHLAKAPTFYELWPQIYPLLKGRCLVAHGYGTEKRHLNAFVNHGLGPWVDTLLLGRALFSRLESHKLGDLCDSLGLTEEVDVLLPAKKWHDALYDATASLSFLKAIIERGGIKDAPLELLMSPDTSQWHALKRQRN